MTRAVKEMHPERAFEVPTLTPFLDRYTAQVAEARTPAAVLDAMDAFARRLLPIHAHGAARFPRLTLDWGSIRLGRDVFLHSSVPHRWWEEYSAMARREHDPGVMMVRASLAALTWTEAMQMLDPVGIDRWPYDLSLKYGIRDLLGSVGRRWLVSYWSPKPLIGMMTQPQRIVLFAVAGFAALRFEQLIGEDLHAVSKRSRVTPRELAVLRLLSTGRQTSEIATVLGLGEETVRSHLKKVQGKLGVKNRSHAVAEAIRQQLIP
jgi:DNA-binding CsgD family transcriptional regulator